MADVEIVDHTEEYMGEVDKALEAALEAIGIHLEGEAKEELENSPHRVDTGLLRNSITYALDGEAPAISAYSGDKPSKYTGKMPQSGSYSGNAPKEGGKGRSVMIGTNVEYAIFVHEGHSLPNGKTVAPNRFLKNAYERNRDQISEYIKKAMS